jgi:DUF4097 and DUF4098 domain-containing protein YvlB
MTTKTFAITTPITLVGRIGHGSYRITALDDLTEASVTLTARTEGSDVLERTTVELRAKTLQINSPRQGGLLDIFNNRNRDAIDIDVAVPSGTPLKLSSLSGEFTVTGRCGSADFASGATSVTAEHVDGDLRLRYGSGDCDIERVSGSVQIKSGSGTVNFGDVGGALTSTSGTGRLEVNSVHGAVRFRAGSGGAMLGAIYDNVDLATGSGELRIGVPSGVSAKLDVTTGSGRVDPQLPISETSNGGRAITIRVRTGSGNVHLFPAAA